MADNKSSLGASALNQISQFNAGVIDSTLGLLDLGAQGVAGVSNMITGRNDSPVMLSGRAKSALNVESNPNSVGYVAGSVAPAIATGVGAMAKQGVSSMRNFLGGSTAELGGYYGGEAGAQIGRVYGGTAGEIVGGLAGGIAAPNAPRPQAIAGSRMNPARNIDTEVSEARATYELDPSNKELRESYMALRRERDSIPSAPRIRRGRGSAIRVFHGSPHEFENFSMDKIGTGEGAQAYGDGLYFAENPSIAEDYRKQLTQAGDSRIGDRSVLEVYEELSARADRLPIDLAGAEYEKMGFLEDLDLTDSINEAISRIDDPEVAKWARSEVAPQFKPAGYSYEANLNVGSDELLNWDASLAEQSPKVRNQIESMLRIREPDGFFINPDGTIDQDVSGRMIYDHLSEIERDKIYSSVDVMNKRLSELSKEMEEMSIGNNQFSNPRGYDLKNEYDRLLTEKVNFGQSSNPKRLASNRLRENGIAGIQYLDGNSRATGEGTRNYVIFDDSLVDTKRVNDKLTPSWMDQGARMQRAQDLGYDMDNVFYHGTNKTFEEFDASLGQGARKDTGVFVSNSPDVASSYAGGTSAQVLPLRVRLQNPMKVYADGSNWSKLGPNTRVDLPRRVVNQSEDADLLEELGFDRGSNTRTEPMGTYTLGELFPDRFGGIKDAKLAELFDKDSYLPMTTNDVSRWAKKQGVDGVIFEDISDRGSRGSFDNDKASMPSRNAIIFDPKDIRSVNAEFDPTKADSADLLSSRQSERQMSALRGIA